MKKDIQSYFHNVKERFKSLREGRKGPVYSLHHDRTGLRIHVLTLENENKEEIVHWEQVETASIFKIDLFTVDCICLDFSLNEDKVIEINEEMQGWDSLIAALPDYLPGFLKLEDWFAKVAFPAFEENLTEVYNNQKQNCCSVE